jgi:hypothetical protein
MSITTTLTIDELLEVSVASALIGMSGQVDLRETVSQYPIESGGSIKVGYNDISPAIKINEGEDGSLTEINTAGVTLSPSESAFVRFAISDIAQVSARSLVDVRSRIAGAKLLARFNRDIFDTFTGATLKEGDGTGEITVDMISKAKVKLMRKDVPGPHWLVITPHQFLKLHEDLRDNYGEVLSGNQADAILSGSGLVPLLGCIPRVVASQIPEAGEIKSAIYSSQAVGWAYNASRPIFAKTIEKPSCTEFVVHVPYDVALVDKNAIVQLHTLGA